MSKDISPIPDDYWGNSSDDTTNSWTLMDEAFYKGIREKFDVDDDLVSPRHQYLFKHDLIACIAIIIPAGRQRESDTMVQYYHMILENASSGTCKCSYQLVSENELEQNWNIKIDKL